MCAVGARRHAQIFYFAGCLALKRSIGKNVVHIQVELAFGTAGMHPDIIVARFGHRYIVKELAGILRAKLDGSFRHYNGGHGLNGGSFAQTDIEGFVVTF